MVEQEWLAVGHKFKDRTWNKNTEDEHSPIFVQVRQLQRAAETISIRLTVGLTACCCSSLTRSTS